MLWPPHARGPSALPNADCIIKPGRRFILIDARRILQNGTHEPVTGSALDIFHPNAPKTRVGDSGPAEPATGCQCLLGALRAPRTAMRIGATGTKFTFEAA